MSDEKKLVSHYELKRLLRRDGFGAVYLGQDTRDGREYALRIIELDSPTLARITGRVRSRSQRDHPLIEQIRLRMKLISELKHSHILPVIEFGEEHIQGNNDIIFYMISPYERESLLSYWSSRASSNEFISLEMIADLIFQAGEALFYVHKRGLIHQYVRLSSFMLRSSARGRRGPYLLLTDFWFADITPALLEEGQIAQALSLYLAPEQLSGRALVTSDQYTLALLAYELLLGHRLSQVDLSSGLYEYALRQRSTGASQAELELAHRLDLVLARALAENAPARFANIEEFVYTFRAVARGEAIDLSDEETFELPVVAGGPQAAHGETLVAGAVAALAAGELAENVAQTSIVDSSTAGLLAAAQIDEQARPEHRPGLHKTVLTSEGMGAGELLAAEVQEQVVREEEHIQSSESSTAAFAAGLAAGEALAQEWNIAEERTQVGGSSAAGLTAGEVFAQEWNIAEERTQVGGSSAAGLTASEAFAQERNIAEERTQVGGSSAAGLTAGEVFAQEWNIAEERTQVGGSSAAGLAASEAFAQERNIAEERTQVGGSSAAGLAASEAFAQERNIAEERTQVGGSSAAGLAASEAFAQERNIAEERTQSGGSSAAGLTAGEAPLFVQGTWTAGQQTQGMQEQTLATGGASLFAGGAIAGAGEVTQLAAVGGSAAQRGGVVQQARASAGGMGAGVPGKTQVGAGLVPAGGVALVGGGRRRRILQVALLSVLLLALVGGGLLVFASSQAVATVTLTLQSRIIQSTYLLTATTTTAAQGQVQAMALTQTVVQSKTAHASGYFPGLQASGFITLQNTSTSCGCPIFIPADTPFTSSTGVRVVTDTDISVAAQCMVTVAAHATIYGSGGNLPAGSIHATFGAHILGTNHLAFTGGQSGQSHALVQQADINGLTSALQVRNEQNAYNSLKSRLQSGQRLAGMPLCRSKTAADHPAGTIAMNVTVTMTTTCAAEAYDFSGVLQIVGQKVQAQAASYFNSDFVEVGTLQASVTNAAITDANSGTLLLAVQATGKWAYRFGQGLKQSLAKVIAGKDVSQVRALLSSEAGIAAVNITISGPGQNTLPSDDARITIVLKT